MNIENKVIVITGAGQGLGLETAAYLAKKGANLALIDLDQSRLEHASERCSGSAAAQGFNIDVKTYVGNVSVETDVINVFAQIKADFGALHVLVNNAGITRDSLLLKVKDGAISKRMSLEQWQSVIDVNLTGVFLCGREAATHMLENDDESVIINISSISKAGNVGQTNYSATKAGVESMAVVWARELARYGIRCAAVAPGFMGTEMVANMKAEAREKIAKMIPLKRLGEPEHIAQTISFILENDYISGRTIEVDAGLRL